MAERDLPRRRIRYAGDAVTAVFLLGVVTQYVGYAMAVQLASDVSMPPVAIGRSVLSGLMFLVLGLAWSRRFVVVGRAVVLGVVAAAMNVMSFMAADSLPLGVSTGIEFIGPIMLAVIGVRSLRAAAIAATAFAGVAALYLRVGVPNFEDTARVGLIYGLASAALWATYIVLGESNRPLRETIPGFGVGLMMGGIGTAAIAAGAGRLHYAVVDVTFVGRCLLIALLASVIPYAIDLYCLTTMSSHTFAILVSALPLASAAIGWIWLDQALGLIGVVGILLVSGGLVALRTMRAPGAENATRTA